jgi:hypothetical protein
MKLKGHRRKIHKIQRQENKGNIEILTATTPEPEDSTKRILWSARENRESLSRFLVVHNNR